MTSINIKDESGATQKMIMNFEEDGKGDQIIVLIPDVSNEEMYLKMEVSENDMEEVNGVEAEAVYNDDDDDCTIIETSENMNNDTDDDEVELIKVPGGFRRKRTLLEGYWSEEATKLLISLWDKHKSRLEVAERGKKNIVWARIAEQMKQHGIMCTSEDCSNKFRSLRFKYNQLRMNLKVGKVAKARWKYYRLLDAAYNGNDVGRVLRAQQAVKDMLREQDDESREENIKSVGDLEVDPLKEEEPDIKVIMNDSTANENTLWTEVATKHFIRLWSKYRERFEVSRNGKRTKLWRFLANEMTKCTGKYFSAFECSRKWRRLKVQYYDIKDRLSVKAFSDVKWKYFDVMDSLLAKEYETITSTSQNGTTRHEFFKQKLIPHIKVESSKHISEVSTSSPQRLPATQTPTVRLLSTPKNRPNPPSSETPKTTPKKSPPSAKTPQSTIADVSKESNPDFPSWFRNYIERREALEEKREERNEKRFKEQSRLMESIVETNKQLLESLRKANEIEEKKLEAFLKSQNK